VEEAEAYRDEGWTCPREQKLKWLTAAHPAETYWGECSAAAHGKCY